MSVALSVDGRHKAHQLPLLKMWRNSDEFPEPDSVDPRGAEAYYELTQAAFTGTIHHVVDGVISSTSDLTATGTCRITLERGVRAVGIFYPSDDLEPALWFSLPLAPGTASTSGSGATAAVVITQPSFTVRGTHTIRFQRHSGSFTDNQAGALVSRLTTPSRVADITIDTTPRSTTSTWELDPDTGLFVETSSGGPTGRSSVTDLHAPRRERLDQLAAATWLPTWTSRKEFEIITGGNEPNLSTGRDGRLGIPVHVLHLPVRLDGTEDYNCALTRHLWPQVNPDGTAMLEPDEQVLTHWRAGAPRGSYLGDRTKMGGIAAWFEGADGDAAWTLTNKRLLATARPGTPPPSGATAGDWWAVHVRAGWAELLRTEDVDHPARPKKFLAPATPARASSRGTTLGLGANAAVLWMSCAWGMAPPEAEKVRGHVLAWLKAAGHDLGHPATERHDNGRNGVLVRTTTPLTGGPGVTLPA